LFKGYFFSNPITSASRPVLSLHFSQSSGEEQPCSYYGSFISFSVSHWLSLTGLLLSFTVFLSLGNLKWQSKAEGKREGKCSGYFLSRLTILSILLQKIVVSMGCRNTRTGSLYLNEWGRNLETLGDSSLDLLATNKIFSVHSVVQSIYEFSFQREHFIMSYVFTFNTLLFFTICDSSET
jgi:hypothetical protein